MNELIEKLERAKADVDAANANGMGRGVANDRLRNMLVSNFDAIVAGLKKVAELTEEVAALDAALAQADDELRELRKPKGKASKEA